jgi:DNA-binding NarL/FixJ family response regulator
MNNEIKILIADDHPVFRRGLRMIIETDPRLKVVAEAGNGAQAIESIQGLAPQIIVLDVNMPDQTGFDVVRKMRELKIRAEIIFLTMHKDEAIFNTAMDLEAKGYLLKESAIDDIVTGIKTVAEGREFISPQLTSFLFNRSRRTVGLTKEKPTINNLTPTEQRVLKLIAENKTSREIAELLSISYRTIERHRENICNKLEVHGSNSLLKFAIAHKEQLI